LEKAIRLVENNENPALQKAETEWNTALCMVATEPQSKRLDHLQYNIPAPINSTERVKTTIYRISLLRLSILTCPKALFIVIFSVIESFRPSNMANIVENVMIPKPPICISIRIISLPNGEKKAPVSLTINPVTHTALVAVNKLSISAVSFPGAKAIGRLNNTAPINMAVKKLIAIT